MSIATRRVENADATPKTATNSVPSTNAGRRPRLSAYTPKTAQPIISPRNWTARSVFDENDDSPHSRLSSTARKLTKLT